MSEFTGKGLTACLVVCLAVSGFATQLPVRIYTTADGLARDAVSCIVPDSRGFLWFCMAEGLSRFDGYGFVNYGSAQGLPHRTVNAFLMKKWGSLDVAGLGSTGSRLKPAAARIGRPTRSPLFRPCHIPSRCPFRLTRRLSFFIPATLH